MQFLDKNMPLLIGFANSDNVSSDLHQNYFFRGTQLFLWGEATLIFLDLNHVGGRGTLG
jgi:hypothetical protein